MDYEELKDNLKEAFDRYCEDYDIEPTDAQYEQFIDIATTRIEEIMSANINMAEAFEWYKEEINDDLSFVLKWESEGDN